MDDQGLRLWLVAEGVVTEADATTDWDGATELLVAAATRDAALETAREYDAGRLGTDAVRIGGEMVVCAMLRPDEE